MGRGRRLFQAPPPKKSSRLAFDYDVWKEATVLIWHCIEKG